MSELRTDFKDDVLDVTQNEKRKYRVIHNEDGTISLEDETVYLQKGDSFGAIELNEMNEVVNEMLGVDEKLEGFVAHTTSTVASEEGLHGIRYQNEVLEVKGEDGEFKDATSTKALLNSDVYRVKQFNLGINKTMNFADSTLLQDFYYGLAVALDDGIHILGGGANKTAHYIWDGTSWENGVSLPYTFYSGSAVVLNGEIHILGSSDGNNMGYKHYKYNGKEWVYGSNLPYDFYNGSAVVLDGEIHILGGSNGYTKHYKWNGTSWTSVSTLPYNFYNGSAVVLDGKIHILGGSVGHTNHYKWDGQNWLIAPAIPYNFYSGSAVVLDGEIHLLGGTGSPQNHYKYNGEEWVSEGTLPYNFYNDPAVVVDGKIYIIGSAASEYRKYFYMYTGTEWVLGNGERFSLPYDFRAGQAVILDGELHILGSVVETSYTSHYKWNGISWENVSTLPYNFYYGSAVVLDDGIHILGGGANKTAHYIWDGTSWENVSTLPYNFYFGSAVVLDGEIHIMGSSDSNYFKYHYKWNGTSWTSVSTLPYNFYNGSAVVLDGEIHILGCQDSSFAKYHYKWNGTKWTIVSTLPYNFYNGSAVVLDGVIYTIGNGYYNDGKYPYAQKYYKYNGEYWENVVVLPYNFYSGSAVVFNDEIHIMGGSGASPYARRFRCIYGVSNLSRHIKNFKLIDKDGKELELSCNVVGKDNEITQDDFVIGNNLKALGNQVVIGHHNDVTTSTAGVSSGTSTGTAFCVGIGTPTSKANAFRIDYRGTVYNLSTSMSTGADYSEYFEWEDGNEENEDRVGYFVTFDDKQKIRKANATDDYILGIVSGLPCIIGNGDECWRGRYIYDEFGRFIEERFEYKEEVDGKTVTKTGTKYKENPDYNPNQEYVERAKRKEWSAIGMIGVLSVYDDGTCQENGYCTVSDGGIATACEYSSAKAYRVLERVTDNIVKVLFK